MIRPMLGCNVDLEQLTYPVYASTKLDGVRVIVNEGVVYSRTGKPIPNPHVQELFSKFHGVDGELIVGEPTASDVFRKTTSGVMSKTGEPDVHLFAFDMWNVEGDLDARYTKLIQDIGFHDPRVHIVSQQKLHTLEQLLTYEKNCITAGYEGVIVRDPSAKYKQGRSTPKEKALMKMKRFKDDEAIVINTEPWYENNNEATTNALGYTERSSKKEGKKPIGLLGALVVTNKEGITFSIGTGFTHQERFEIWNAKPPVIGEWVKYKYFDTGVKEKPRFPVFLGFRDRRDM